MPDLAMELTHLEEADRHIAQARALILRTMEQEQAEERLDSETEIGAESLATMKLTLAAFEEHRALIVQTIADIRAGTLPSS